MKQVRTTPPAPQSTHAGFDLAAMSPSYFGLVMATGIVSLAAFMIGKVALANVLFGLNVIQYGILLMLYACRAALYPRQFFGDMVTHLTGPGYFTLVAGTGVLASQFMIMRGDFTTGWWLWLVTLISWGALTYTIFSAFAVKQNKPTLDNGINGGWLLAVVATQAVSVSSTLLAGPLHGGNSQALYLLSLSTWLCGGMLYIWLITLILYRSFYFRFSAIGLRSPYWINMGAMAISTLAGALLINTENGTGTVNSLQPFIKGFTLLFWATGTWWIPLLLLLGVWRYGYQRFPLRYTPLHWGMVFPLGMYTACTWTMARAMDFPFLLAPVRVFFHIALFAWAATFLGMMVSIIRQSLHKV